MYLHLPPYDVEGVGGCLSNKTRASPKQEHDRHRQLLQVMIASFFAPFLQPPATVL